MSLRDTFQKRKVIYAPVTRQNYFAGLETHFRVEECVKALIGEAFQFKNETAILLNLARENFSHRLVCEVESETGVCLDLASFDIDSQDIAKKYEIKLKSMLI